MADLTAVPTQLITDVADAVRLKRGTAEPIRFEDMAREIGMIEGGAFPFAKKMAISYFIVDPLIIISQNGEGFYIEHNLGDVPTNVIVVDIDAKDIKPYIRANGNEQGVFRFAWYQKYESGDETMVTHGVRNSTQTATLNWKTGDGIGYQTFREVTESGVTIIPYTTINGIYPNHRYYVIAWD